LEEVKMAKFPVFGSRALTALCVAALLASPAVAQQYPTKPIRMVIPLPPGGAIDIVARSTGIAAQEKLGQPFVFDNRPGANTILATEQCVKGAPDGYTLCFLTSNASLNQYLYQKLPYDFVRELEPVTMLVKPWEGLYLNASVPAHNAKELIEYSKANPGKVNFGSLGAGGSPHLLPEWVARNTGANFTHIPYKGLPDLMRAYMAGDIHMMFLALGNPTFLELIKSGKMRVMFFPGDKRNPSLPDVPTMTEAGVPDHGFQSWWGLAVPTGTPREVINRLHVAFIEALRTPAVSGKFGPLGLEIVGNTPEEFRKYIAADLPRAERLVKSSGARLD
jgi:tripartite-type tricarboxylate transporter receptor subunit TctC